MWFALIIAITLRPVSSATCRLLSSRIASWYSRRRTSTSFIDSSGLHITIELHKRSTRQNIRLVIIPGLRAVQRLVEICGLTETLPFAHADERFGGTAALSHGG
jgi:hypothetical protein